MFLGFNFSKGETLSNRSGKQMKSRSEGMEVLAEGSGEAELRQEQWQRRGEITGAEKSGLEKTERRTEEE